MDTTTVQQQESRSGRDTNAERKNQNYPHSTGHVENYGPVQKVRRSRVHQAKSANTEKEQR